MTKITFYTLLMFSIFSCFRKKTPPNNIESWLEFHFPGKFQVQVSNLKMLDVMAQFKGEKRAVIVDKADPEVEFLLDWQKGTASLGLDANKVKAIHEYAQHAVKQSHELYNLLESKGLTNFAVCDVGSGIDIQVFAEPAPATREQTLASIRTSLETRIQASGVRVRIFLMEPTAYRAKFQKIIPQGYYYTEQGWQKEKEIMAISLNWDSLRSRPDDPWTWELNPESERSGQQYQVIAFQQAHTWAEKNLPKPFFMDEGQPIGFELVKHPDEGSQVRKYPPPAVRYAFPYFDKKPTEGTEPKGYVTGVFYPDEQVFTKIRKEREF